MAEASLEEVLTIISPIAATPRSRSVTPPADMGQLLQKANKALEELLATKSSIDACRWKVVWELGMELCQNNSKTAESIKEARAICTHVAMDAEALCSSTVKETKATCACTVQEAENHLLHSHQGCWDLGASQAESLHRWHAETIKHLEEQVIPEEGKSQIDFLSACQAALHASPSDCRGTLVASYHMLMGQGPTSHPFTLSQGASPMSNHLLQQLLLGWHLSTPPGPKGNTPTQTLWMGTPIGGTTSKATLEGPPPAPNGERSHLGTRYSSRAAQKHSARTLAYWGRLGRSTLKSISPSLPQRAWVICHRSSGIWPRVLCY